MFGTLALKVLDRRNCDQYGQTETGPFPRLYDRRTSYSFRTIRTRQLAPAPGLMNTQIAEVTRVGNIRKLHISRVTIAFVRQRQQGVKKMKSLASVNIVERLHYNTTYACRVFVSRARDFRSRNVYSLVNSAARFTV